MKTVELIYDRDCPNVARARAHLLLAFAEAGLAARWLEWDRGDPASPAHVRDYGSPTVLVGGNDVAGAAPAGGVSCCRLYTDTDGGFRRAPPVEVIAAALKSRCLEPVPGGCRGRSIGWRSSLAMLPGIGASLLPAGVCPACWPAYAGLLGSLGLGFLLETAYLLPLTGLFLVIAVAALAHRARARRGYGPFLLGLGASAVVLLGKFLSGSDAAMYGGVVLLVAASTWNAWPRKTAGRGGDACPACAPGGRASCSTQPGAGE